MKLKITLLLLTAGLLFTAVAKAQVGINTVTPDNDAMLDITSSSKGALLPRVALTSTSSFAPLSAHVAGMLLYNTASINDVTPGYYYNDGSQWVRMSAINDDWKLEGNTGTTPGTGPSQNFIGTTDTQDLVIATDGTERFRVLSDGRIQASAHGTAANPLFSWADDADKGFYSIGADQFGIATNGIERFNITNTELVANDPGNDVNFRVETSGNANTLFIDGGLNSIGVGTAAPNGIFDMTSTTMGMILPRVALTSTLVEAPVVNPQGGGLVAGTCVYNTNTAGTAPNNVAPGLYFWDGSKWVAFVGAAGGKDWTLTGNAGTNTTSNFLGSTDNVGVAFRTNNTERMQIEDDGQVTVGFNGAPAFLNTQFSALANITNGHGITGMGNGTGYGIRAYNTSAYSGAGAALLALSNNYSANVIALNQTANGNGIISAGNNLPLYSYPNSGAGGSFTGTTIGTTGIAIGATGTGTTGTGNGRTTSVTDTRGSGVAGSGNALGVFGYAGFGAVANGNRGNAGARFILDADNDVTTITGNNGDRATAILAGFNNIAFTDDGGTTYSARDSYFGGYFGGGSVSSGTPSYAYVVLRYRTNSNGDGVASGGTDFKIVGPGSNSTLIEGPKGEPRIMFSPEAPEILFQDFGVGKLVNGQARIELDPILKSALYVDNKHPLKVYVTLEGECNGIYVTNKSIDGFTVKELQNGTSNVSFSWQIVANRADRVSANGTLISQHVGIRLPEGPGPIKGDHAKEDKVSAHTIDENSITPNN
jgi:hypothetical protein